MHNLTPGQLTQLRHIQALIHVIRRHLLHHRGSSLAVAFPIQSDENVPRCVVLEEAHRREVRRLDADAGVGGDAVVGAPSAGTAAVGAGVVGLVPVCGEGAECEGLGERGGGGGCEEGEEG